MVSTALIVEHYSWMKQLLRNVGYVDCGQKETQKLQLQVTYKLLFLNFMELFSFKKYKTQPINLQVVVKVELIIKNHAMDKFKKQAFKDAKLQEFCILTQRFNRALYIH
eukprot:TRINITY_DN7212_c0_g1_i2.p5 TRINITY_DN7212_c0_g1~~TRINITY_DN7212_c0_g1_i2.p5  ORF type:complete len:109 (+),score=2.22 TRINITY_DN7212_c0_g1_i2:609-935(+)